VQALADQILARDPDQSDQIVFAEVIEHGKGT
jgi:hypothetical protein